MICRLCEKLFNDESSMINHLMFKHTKTLMIWCRDNKKSFKIATKNDGSVLIATYFCEELK